MLKVRKATSQDSAGVLECLRSAFEEYRAQYASPAFADTVLDPNTIQQRLHDMCLFVAVRNGSIVGTIGCVAHGKDGHLRGMAVLPEEQGRGVAFMLLQAAEAELIEQGCCLVTLGSTQPLTRAIRFYEKHGYTRSGRISDFFGMQLHEYTKTLCP